MIVRQRNPVPIYLSLIDNTIKVSVDYSANKGKQLKVKEYQHEIDRMVYELYGLTPEEIAVMEGTFQK